MFFVFVVFQKFYNPLGTLWKEVADIGMLCQGP